MTQTTPTVVILLASYNGERFLREQIDSIRAQTYDNWCLLMSDDGSTDASERILKAYAEADGRMKVVLGGVTFGSAQAHFLALLDLVGDDYDYVMFCDQDDVWDADKVAREVAEARRLEAASGSDTPVLVCSDLRVVDEDRKLIAPSFIAYQNLHRGTPPFSSLLIDNMVTGCTVLINRALVRLVRLTPPGTYMVMHDWWFGLIATSLGVMSHIDDATMSYRLHAANTLGAAEYSLAAVIRAWNWETQCVNMRDSIEQARSFQEVYGSLLEGECRRRLSHYCALRDYPRIGRVVNLFRSHAWKTGLPRRVGEFVAIVFSRRI